MWYGSGTYNWQLAQQMIDCRNILYEIKFYGDGDFSFAGILKFVVDNSRESGYNKCRFAAMCRQIYREQEKNNA